MAINSFPWDSLVSPVLFVHPSSSCAAGRCLAILWYPSVGTELQLPAAEEEVADPSLAFLVICTGYTFKSHICGHVVGVPITRAGWSSVCLFCDC